MKGRDERGVTLVETMIAVLIAMIGVFSLGSIVFQATATNKNQGTETTRAVIYAQDKMEKLLSLGSLKIPTLSAPNFSDCILTPGMPSYCNTTNISDTGWTTGLLAGGDITTFQSSCPSSAPWVGYVDFLDASGMQLPSGGPAACSTVPLINIAYVRQWKITDISTAHPALKQITVAVYSQLGVNTAGGKPIVVITSVLEDPNPP